MFDKNEITQDLKHLKTIRDANIIWPKLPVFSLMRGKR